MHSKSAEPAYNISREGVPVGTSVGAVLLDCSRRRHTPGRCAPGDRLPLARSIRSSGWSHVLHHQPNVAVLLGRSSVGIVVFDLWSILYGASVQLGAADRVSLHDSAADGVRSLEEFGEGAIVTRS